MSAQSAVYAALAGAAAVTALIGARLYPDEAPQDTALPLVIHQATQADPEYALDGARAYVRTQVAVTCWAASRAEANALADACCAALEAPAMRWIGRDDSVFDVNTGAYASVVAVDVFQT